MRLFVLPLLLGLASCSLQKMALRSSTPVFEKSSAGMMKEGNWEFFRASSPGNIKFLELLWLQDPANHKLLSVLIKSYSGYAFTVPETLLMEDSLTDVEDSRWKQESIDFYTRAMNYGVHYLKERGITKKELLASDTKKLTQKLKNLGEEDLMAVLYTGQSWGSLINLQKDNVSLVSQVANVKSLFDFVCSRRPDIDNNVCDIFYAQYFSARPKMLGGDPEKGEELFLAAIKKHPKNLLIRLSYIQYAILPAMDAEKYEKEASALRKSLSEWDSRGHSDLNLYNAIAKKRLEIIEKNKATIF